MARKGDTQAIGIHGKTGNIPEVANLETSEFINSGTSLQTLFGGKLVGFFPGRVYKLREVYKLCTGFLYTF